MRRALIERDLVDCVLGLGPNLFYNSFYNSPMEACVVVCRTRKPPKRRGRVLFLDAVREVARERAQSFLTAAHQQRILKAYRAFADEPGFAAVATTADVLANDGNLSIPRYVRRPAGDLRSAWAEFDAGSRDFWRRMDEVVEMLDGVVAEQKADG